MNNIISDSVGLILNNQKTLRIGLVGPEYDSEKKFINDIPKFFSKSKCVIVAVLGYNPAEYSTNLEFCKAIKAKLDALQVPHYFVTPENTFTSTAAIAANITVKFQEIILFVNVSGGCVHILELEYTKNGYKKLGNNVIEFSRNESHQTLREKILGSTNFKKIVLAADDSDRKFFKTVLHTKKLIILDHVVDYSTYAAEMIKWFFDRSYTKFHIIPTCARKYALAVRLNHNIYHLITADAKTSLPYEKTVAVPKLFKNNIFYSYCESINNEWLVQSISFNRDVHKIHLTLTVDTESFSKIEANGEILTHHELLPKNLIEKMTEKIPVIVFYDYSSVICVNKVDGYKFLDSWNGEFGKELIIGFENKKPTFCENALELLMNKPTYAVYDLIKVMSMPADKIVPDKLWTFTVTKDSEHPVLLEFDSFDGTKKAASPSFLMAILLRQHLKVIQAEIGEKPSELGIRIFDDFNEEERARVEAGLKEACDLLKTDCSFV